MRLSEEWIKNHKNEVPLMKEAIEDPDRKGIQHPYYWQFKQGCGTILGLRDGDIETLWIKLLHGYKEQLQKVEDARKSPDVKTIGEYLGRINSNPFFTQFVEEVCRLTPDALKTQGKELALWTGGYPVSKEAQNLGYCTLEVTKLGGIFNTLPVTPEWDREEALWNILSKRFVEEYNGKIAHIYFRNVDELCVLFQQEIPALKQKEGTVFWHPLGNNPGGDMYEIGYIKESKTYPHINLEQRSKAFPCACHKLTALQTNAFDALWSGIHTGSPIANKYTIEHFRSGGFMPNRAPFARDLEETSGNGINDFLQKFWV